MTGWPRPPGAEGAEAVPAGTEKKRITRTENSVEKEKNMKIYNTLTRRKDEFVPLEPGKVKMYV